MKRTTLGDNSVWAIAPAVLFPPTDAAPAREQPRFDWYVGGLGKEQRLYVEFAPHQYVNAEAAVVFRMPVGGRVWVQVEDLIAAARRLRPFEVIAWHPARLGAARSQGHRRAI